MVNRYRKLRIDEGSNPETDTATDLIDAFQRWGGVEGFVLNTKNQWKTSTQPHAPYKACAALEAATILADHSIETVSDVAEHLDSPDKRKNSDIAKHWLAIKGQRSGLTWHYFLMLVGVPGIKADRMIIRFATQALGYTQDVSPKEAVRLIEEVAESMRVNYTHLDHTIWRYQSGRPYLQANPAQY